MITALLVAISFNYPQAVHNIKLVARHGACLAKTLHPCKKTK